MSSIPFLFRPEAPIAERLVGLTDVLKMKNGHEQRIAMRIAPRQEFTYNYAFDEITERPIVENILLTAQKATFSVPLWSDVSALTSAITSGDTTINLDTTVSDFREGNNLLILATNGSYEILTVTSQSTTQINLTAGTANNWPIGTEVYPLQDCLITRVVPSSRAAWGLVSYTFDWSVLDASINLGITPPPYNYLGIGNDEFVLVVDDPNMIDNVIQESSDMGIVLIDENTGPFTNITYQASARRGSNKTWLTTNRTGLWRVRKFIHQMNGQQTSFLVPTFAHDITVVANIASGASTLNVANVGLTTYSGLGNAPRQYIRVELVSGVTYTALVLSTSVLSSTVEQITVLGTWPANVTVANVYRVSVLERVRFASDTVNISHLDLLGKSKISCPIIAVLEGTDYNLGGGGGVIIGDGGGGVPIPTKGTGGGSTIPNPHGLVPCVVDGSSPPTVTLTVTGGVVTSDSSSWCGNGVFTCSMGSNSWGTNLFCDHMGSQGITCATLGDGSNLPPGTWYYFEFRVQLNVIFPVSGGGTDSPAGASGSGSSLSGDVTGINVSVSA